MRSPADLYFMLTPLTIEETEAQKRARLAKQAQRQRR